MESVQNNTDPDPGGPKNIRILYRSGSTTLVLRTKVSRNMALPSPENGTEGPFAAVVMRIMG